jgi:hypothetical protein
MTERSDAPAPTWEPPAEWGWIDRTQEVTGSTITIVGTKRPRPGREELTNASSSFATKSARPVKRR